MSLLGFKDDLREALRRIRRSPRTTMLAVGTLGLGIGGATAVFTMAHTVLFAPPPYREPDRLVFPQGLRNGREQGISLDDFADYRREPGLFDAAALTSYAEFSWSGQSLPGFDGAEVLRGLNVTADYFRVLDQPMAAGRGFAPEEGEFGRNQVAVISYALWQRRFAGRPEVVGQMIALNDRSYTIVGVAGPRFLPYQGYEVLIWAPFNYRSGGRASRQFACLARLQGGVTNAQAQRRLDALNARLGEAYPATNKDYKVTLNPLLGKIRERARPAFLALVGAVSCLLLIAAANVASLLLARATTQAREMAVCVALGAGRWRLYRMMLGESLMLALMAGAAGALVGAWLMAAAKALMPASLQYDWFFALDTRVLTVAFLISAFAGIVAGLAPAFESFRLAAGGLRPSFGRGRLLRTIVTAEIALAVFLSVGAGLLGKSFAGLFNRPLGYDTQRLLGMRIRLTGERYKGYDRRADYWSQLVERVGNLPGVAKAASISDLPMGGQYSGGGFEIAGHTVGPEEAKPRAHQIIASPGYFATVGIPLLAGRGFAESDGPQAEPVVIVNDLLAETYWPGQNPIGREIKLWDGAWRRVVGVVRRIRHGGPEDDFENEIYAPYRQINVSTMFLVVRAHVPPESLVSAIRGTMKSIDATVPAFEIRSMEKAFDRQIAGPRLPMVFTTVFAGLASLLAGLGLFGVVAYWVAQRTKEFGIRTAVGAQTRDLRALVLKQGGRLAIAGLALGLGASVAVMRLIRSLLYGMSERDPWVYLGAVALAAATTLLACWLPAGRAARIDPAAALRDDA